MKSILVAAIAAGALALSGWATADSVGTARSPNASDMMMKPGFRAGILALDQHVYYPGETINARITLPSSLTGYWSGQADAHVLVFEPDGSLLGIKVAAPQPDSQQGLATVSTDQMAAGEYQLALVLVKSGGDPTRIPDWYGGFAGLVSTQRVLLSATANNSEDPTHICQVYGDLDGDGYPDNATGNGQMNGTMSGSCSPASTNNGPMNGTPTNGTPMNNGSMNGGPM